MIKGQADTFSHVAGVPGRPRHLHATVKPGSFMGTFILLPKLTMTDSETGPG